METISKLERAKKKLTPAEIRTLFADLAEPFVPGLGATRQAMSGNYGQAAVSGLLDFGGPIGKAAGLAAAPLMGAIKAYHGTPVRGLLDLSPRKAMEVRDSVWFSDNPNVADQYRYPREYGEILYDEPAGDLLTANLLFKNPMTVDMSGDVGEAMRLGKLLNEAKTKGFDALVLKNVDDTIDSSKELGTSFAVWNPELIQLIERNNKKIKAKK